MNLYSLHDLGAEEYGAPFVAANDTVAVRNVRVGLPQDHIGRQYPKEFRLVCVGTWDPETGTIAVPDVNFAVRLDSVLAQKEEVSGG